MKAHPTYKDSGIEWIGEIPEHWNRTALKRVVKIKITDGPHETPEFIESGIPFISAEGIKNGKVDFNFKRGYISEEVHMIYSKKCKPEKGDVFIVKSGSTTGKVAYVDTDIEFNIWSPIALVRPGNKFNGKYLFYFCGSECFQKQIQLFWSFGTQPNIGMGVLENLFIAFPSNKEQTTIANFLDHKTAQIDQSIEKQRALIELLQEQRAAIINEAVTKGINPNVPMKDSGIEWIGEIPAHWEVKRLKYCARFLGGYAFSSVDFQDHGIQLIKIGNLYQNQLSLERSPTFLPESFLLEYEDYVVSNNDILMSLTGTLGKRDYGYAILINSHNKYLLNQRVGKLTFDSKVSTSFAIHLLQSEAYLNQLFLLPSGTKQGNFNSEQILSVKMGIPLLEEQQQIVQYIETETTRIDQEIAATQKEIELLGEYRQALIAEAVTGKIDVRDYALED